MHSIEIHFLYASVVWIAAWLLTSMERGTATTKYWIWVATSINFFLPLSAVPGRFWPSHISWFTPQVALNTISFGARTTAIVWVVWSAGAALMLARLYLRIRADRRASDRGGPAVRGLLRPHVFLPEGIDRLLTGHELNAVLIHELTHARRRDNLIRLIYELGLCVLWFHPFVWFTGSRLALYRELSCDESVTDSARLVSALAKLADPEEALLLQATASSFIRLRLARLTAAEPQRTYAAANTMLALAFSVVLLAAAIGLVAQSAARYLCALTHGTAR